MKTSQIKARIQLLDEWISMDRETIRFNDDELSFFGALKSRSFDNRWVRRDCGTIIAQARAEQQQMRNNIAKYKREIRSLQEKLKEVQPLDTSESTSDTLVQ